ncbi:peptidoglycan D,D-transpeptidase FtsI family protein [Sulfurospirillum sp. 1612]|uniref:peptidoglycan D,D-transpeptidase FtsI family protein n=1 Tax=Sulfurospirillum sp. 1612 TaxID=3094835 RepID=UPI002F92B66E
MQSIKPKTYKILFLFSLIFIGFVIFLSATFYWATAPRRLPTLTYKEVTHAMRGDIISRDDFRVATSKKLYKVTVDTRNIDPQKKELFVKLYSLYSGDDARKVLKTINSRFGSVVLSYSIDSKKAKYLKNLARKLFSLKVFISYEDPKTKDDFIHGMSVEESGEKRIYPAKDTLTPVVGYIRKIEKNRMTTITGVKGIEKYYEDKLAPIQDSILKGHRDIANTVILDRYSMYTKRMDGLNVYLNISLKLQKVIEKILDDKKKDLEAQEIIACVMDSKTGAILALATSNRYNPDFIRRVDYPSLNVSAIEYSYEPGSVMKPITFSLLLEANKVNPFDLVRIFGGKYRIGRKVIHDTHDFEWLSAEDVIVHSSNVGISQLAQKLDPIEFYKGLKDFGFSKKSGIDLPYEAKGAIPPLHKFESEIYKATIGYGYGLDANFMQVLKAYSVFNNNGRMVTPKIAKRISSDDGKYNLDDYMSQKQVIPVAVAKRMHKILIKTVLKGTGKAAIYDGLEIGGKTGTAHIAGGGGYTNKYNSSFFGFANDKTSRYTIGVLVRDPEKRYHYYASQTAVPTFREIVDKLVEEGFLKPSLSNQ